MPPPYPTITRLPAGAFGLTEPAEAIRFRSLAGKARDEADQRLLTSMAEEYERLAAGHKVGPNFHDIGEV